MVQNLTYSLVTWSLHPKATGESCKTRKNLLHAPGPLQRKADEEEWAVFILAGEGISDLVPARRRINVVIGALWGPVFQCHPPQSPTCHSL